MYIYLIYYKVTMNTEPINNNIETVFRKYKKRCYMDAKTETVIPKFDEYFFFLLRMEKTIKNTFMNFRTDVILPSMFILIV